MKRKNNLYKTTSIFFVCTVLILSCEKEKLTSLTPDNLTECPTCETHFRESSRLEALRVVDGKNIVFQYKKYWSANHTDGTPYTGLFFEIPKGRTFFNLDKNTIASEKVVHITMCPNCNTIPLKPIGGKLKGEQIDSKRWLVEAAVALAGPDGRILDTLSFKHYFTRD
ncbi:hypothetical protein GCM10011386_04790 [Parapedobacter defluvii]|uniref:Lipoprotein n=1 Tax=Parapedobacter defluvii TaxID=2045106 RepID=A0ABQ1L393_9SPHI|nr:hypothetical protein [Parapedobacter defluvii]GGC16043.1 hypothetical protein GCM10011386_04790 [Parapedobacter defluvii]